MDNIIYSAFFLVYALATVPLIRKLTSSVKQTWYADDAAATGKISDLRVWWDEITHLGGTMQMLPRPALLSRRSFNQMLMLYLVTPK